jgi:hypothetical protein
MRFVGLLVVVGVFQRLASRLRQLKSMHRARQPFRSPAHRRGTSSEPKHEHSASEPATSSTAVSGTSSSSAKVGTSQPWPLNLAAEWIRKITRAASVALLKLRALPQPATYQARLKADYALRQREIVLLRQ